MNIQNISSGHSFLNPQELLKIGFASVGSEVFISRNARFYGVEQIEIGNHVRIDDFCILSGKIKLGDFIHISAFSALYGAFGIEMGNYSGLSPRCTVFSASDDFSGDYLIGPMVPMNYRGLQGGKVTIREYVQIGAGSILMPNIIINEGTAIGAMSLVNRSTDAWHIYAGIPAKKLKARSKNMLNYLSLAE